MPARTLLLSVGRWTASLPGRLRGVNRAQWLSVGATVAIIVVGIVITAIFQKDINAFGVSLLESAGQGTVDVALFLLTAVSSTLLTLPIWGYVLAGVSIGYEVPRLALIMAVGSATGSLSTHFIGRYLSNRPFVKSRFPEIHNHPWTVGRSRRTVTLFLFLGTASPIPCDVFYLACGAKEYPAGLFWIATALARFVRYAYLGYGFSFALG